MTPHVTMTPARALPGRHTTLLLLLTALLGALLVGTTAPADASSTYGRAALAEAREHAGKPYAYGAAGPDRFDCSGFTMYLFRQQGKSLPHSSSDQYAKISKIAKTSKQPGDLIFTYDSSGRIYHVGIYEGDGVMWAATKSGDTVRRQRIWTSSYKVGRVT